MKKLFTKNLKVTLLSAFAVVAMVFAFSSCDEDLTSTATCTGCSADFPWSTSTSGTCYSTFSACDADESGSCVICR